MVCVQKARIKWQCRRGMLELDLILERFISLYLDKLTDEQLQTFERLLKATDTELYAWLIGLDNPIDPIQRSLVALIRMSD